MNVVMRHTVLILFVWLMLAGVCLAKQVYLKDGGIIESQSVWRQGDKVFVKINRDIVTDFDLNEINLRRTFPKTAPSSRHLRRTVAAKGAIMATKPVPAPVAVESAPPAPTVATPVPQPAVQPAPPPAAPVATESPLHPLPVAALHESGFPLFVALAISILIVAAQWVIFVRAGQAGWKCLVPFYNMYVLMEIAGKPGWWMFLMFIPLVGLVFFLFAMLSLAKKFGRSELFGVGLLLLPMIFLPLLAFGGSEYEG